MKSEEVKVDHKVLTKSPTKPNGAPKISQKVSMFQETKKTHIHQIHV